MIDVDGIREILKKSDLYIKENNKNFICKCPYCGDRKKQHNHDHGHGYLSKDDNVPVYHCFYCNYSTTINKLIFDITGEKRSDLIQPINNKNYVKKVFTNNIKYNIPELNSISFPLKSLYMRRRTFNKLELSEIPNLIFDVKEFFKINNLNINNYILPFEQEHIQDNMVCFLSKRHTILYCRAISNNVQIKFKKIVLQKEKDNVSLDYYCIDNCNVYSNNIVLAEGNFDILACYGLNTLNLRENSRCFCAGCTFSYEQLLKSVCYDFGIYKCNVILLSDSDKKQYHYKNFLYNCKPLINKIDIYYNSVGKDFGTYPNIPVKLF